MSTNSIPQKPPPTAAQQNPPNQTLFVSSLNDKINKTDLRRALYMLFSTYGPVLDVVVLKSNKMRGQAHIVYRDINTSTQAMRALQGFDFFGKEMRLQYGRGRSDVISRLSGTVRVPEPPKAQAATELQKSIFAAPPGSAAPTGAPGTAAPAAALGAPPNGTVAEGGKSPQGTKRTRDEDSEDEDQPMEESDEGEEMDVSDDDD